jgi:hypothetical protein
MPTYFVPSVSAVDADWPEFCSERDSMVAYGEKLNKAGGLLVTSQGIELSGLPDGAQQQWRFPQGLTEPITINIDLGDNHPAQLDGVELRWLGHQPPSGYWVRYAGAVNTSYADATAPDLTQLSFPQGAASVAVPFRFDPGIVEQDGVRYVQLEFPAGMFATSGATLADLRILMNPGNIEDAEENPSFIMQVPDCAAAYPEPACLWPANHKMVDVAIKGITGAERLALAPTITAISSDESTSSARGSGGRNHAPDGDGLGEDSALLRAERSGTGDGRVYVIHFIAEEEGRQCSGSVTVRVPHHRYSNACIAVDSGQNFDATEGD